MDSTTGDGLVAMLQGALDLWGEQISSVYDWLTVSSTSFSAFIHSWVLGVQTTLIGVGDAFCLLFFWIGFFRICASFSELKRPEILLKHFLRTAFAMVMVHNLNTVLSMIEDIGIGLTEYVLNYNSETIDLSLLFSTHGIVGEEVIREYNEDLSLTGMFTMGFSDLAAFAGTFLLAWVGSGIMKITALACGVYLKGIVIMRYFLLYIAQIIGVVAVSTIASESTQNHAIQYIKYYAGLCLRMFTMSIIILVYYKFVTTGNTLWNMVASTPTTPSEAIWATIGWFFLVLVPFMMTMITSDRILKEALAL